MPAGLNRPHHDWIHKEIVWNARDEVLLPVVNDIAFREPSRKIYITVTDTLIDNGDTCCDWEDIERLLGRTWKHCRNTGIDVYTTEEMGVRERIRDFLLLGRVQ